MDIETANAPQNMNKVLPITRPSIRETIAKQKAMSADLQEETDENGNKRFIIQCRKVKRQELNKIELLDVRIYYWAAFYGYDRYVKYMIL